MSAKNLVMLSISERITILEALLFRIDHLSQTSESVKMWEAYRAARALALRKRGPRPRWQGKEDNILEMLKDVGMWITELRLKLGIVMSAKLALVPRGTPQKAVEAVARS